MKNLTNGIPVPISPGEMIDKITILEIKTERLADPKKKNNVITELTLLNQVYQNHIQTSDQIKTLTQELKKTNEKLWVIEDDIRDCERNKDFGPTFIKLARAVYQTNDHRASLKRQINQLLSSGIIEEKSYSTY